MKTLIKIVLAFMIAAAAVNPVSAQNKKEMKQAKKAAEIKELITSKDYIFEANYMYPLGGGSRYLTSPYDVTVSQDTIQSYLPYFGVAYSGVGYNNNEDNGVKFTSTDFKYTADLKKDGSYKIYIKPADTRSATQMLLDVYTNGNASLSVLSNNRQSIRFSGIIKAKAKPKS